METLKLWQGRYFVYDDKRKKRIPRARYIIEKSLGRELNSDEVVHHINEIKTDDRIENLQLMSFSSHRSHHARKYFTEEDKKKSTIINSKSYYDKHIEQIKAYDKTPAGRARIKRWRDKNVPHIKEYERKYRKDNKEKMNQYAINYRIKNREKLRLNAKLYRESKKDVSE